MNDERTPKRPSETSPPSSVRSQCIAPVLVGELLSTVVMSWIIAENIATGTIEFPDSEVEK